MGSESSSPDEQVKALRQSLWLAVELADALQAQAERVRGQVQELASALADVDSLLDGPGAAAFPSPAVSPARPPGDAIAPARLAAMSMAAQGRTRDEVVAYLRSLDVAAVDDIVEGLDFRAEPGY